MAINHLGIMWKVWQISVIAVLLATGCSSRKTAKYPDGLPVCYHNWQNGLTFYLPASWRGYSVSIMQLEDQKYSPAQDERITVSYTPMITLQNPTSCESSPYQDIPILVFTRAQWDDLNHADLWPSYFAGGVMDELWHNQKYVFAMSSRYNAEDDVRGCAEVARIIEQNRAANKMPEVYLPP